MDSIPNRRAPRSLISPGRGLGVASLKSGTAQAQWHLLYHGNPQRQQGILDGLQHDTPLLTLRVSKISSIGREPSGIFKFGSQLAPQFGRFVPELLQSQRVAIVQRVTELTKALFRLCDRRRTVFGIVEQYGCPD